MGDRVGCAQEGSAPLPGEVQARAAAPGGGELRLDGEQVVDVAVVALHHVRHVRAARDPRSQLLRAPYAIADVRLITQPAFPPGRW